MQGTTEEKTTCAGSSLDAHAKIIRQPLLVFQALSVDLAGGLHL